MVFLLGPTAVGKTELVLRLADRLPVEIVSVDSGLIYRGMDIGTAKPSIRERALVPHHLIDIREPHEAYSAAEFSEEALTTIQSVRGRGAIPLLTGGTMLYFNALEHGLAELPAADAAVRRALEADAARLGWPAMHERLQRIDPLAASRIHPNDPQRLQRALEVFELTGQPLSLLQRATHSRLTGPLLKFAMLPRSRAELHERIARRLARMLADGFIDEVRMLMRDPRLHPDRPAMRSVGYRQAWAYLAGHDSELQMRERAEAATRQLAKRQLTWIRAMRDLVTLPCDPDAALERITDDCQSLLS